MSINVSSMSGTATKQMWQPAATFVNNVTAVAPLLLLRWRNGNGPCEGEPMELKLTRRSDVCQWEGLASTDAKAVTAPNVQWNWPGRNHDLRGQHAPTAVDPK